MLKYLSESSLDVSGVPYHAHCTRPIPSQRLHQIEQSLVGKQGLWINDVVSILVYVHPSDTIGNETRQTRTFSPFFISAGAVVSLPIWTGRHETRKPEDTGAQNVNDAILSLPVTTGRGETWKIQNIAVQNSTAKIPLPVGTGRNETRKLENIGVQSVTGQDRMIRGRGGGRKLNKISAVDLPIGIGMQPRFIAGRGKARPIDKKSSFEFKVMVLSIKFQNIKQIWNTVQYYEAGDSGGKCSSPFGAHHSAPFQFSAHLFRWILHGVFMPPTQPSLQSPRATVTSPPPAILRASLPLPHFVAFAFVREFRSSFPKIVFQFYNQPHRMQNKI
ncbi:hypothetical protein AVEN_226680-1 [Araneus ventricosus]|uniref:Uncharacterized protein n=1 Tax=Araneus ventricosus TaxID=182803 RepID=A0A4Y2CYH8_ARAVE|nr:hypothetical protein AVEN_226680-1 [Araneus ventricosus]